jgi:cobalt-zinc-cadmium resistance protein CzcA
MNNIRSIIMMNMILKRLTVALTLLCSAFSVSAQRSLTLDEALGIALKNNQLIQSAEFRIDYFKQMKKTSTEIGKLSASWMHGQYNSLYQDNNLTFTQSIPFPTVLSNQHKLGQEQVIGAAKNLSVVKNELAFQVKSSFYQLQYLEALRLLISSQDSLFEDFARASSIRYKTGESNLLEKTTAESQLMEVKNQAALNLADVEIAKTHLQALLKFETPVSAAGVLQKRELAQVVDSISVAANPQLNYLQHQSVISRQAKITERSRMLPDLTIGYFNQSLIGTQNINGQDQRFNAGNRFQGFQLGVSIPLWFGPQVARSKAAAFAELETKKNAEHFKTTLAGTFAQAQQELNKFSSSLNYYESSALKNANLILTQSKKSFKAGEIGYIEYLQSLKNAIIIKSNYLQVLNQYNQSVIKIEFLTGTL